MLKICGGDVLAYSLYFLCEAYKSIQNITEYIIMLNEAGKN